MGKAAPCLASPDNSDALGAQDLVTHLPCVLQCFSSSTFTLFLPLLGRSGALPNNACPRALFQALRGAARC